MEISKLRHSPKEVIVETHVDHAEVNRLKCQISDLQKENDLLSHQSVVTEVLYEKVVDVEEITKLKEIIQEKDEQIGDLLCEHEKLDGNICTLNQMLMKCHHQATNSIPNTAEVGFLKTEVKRLNQTLVDQ